MEFFEKTLDNGLEIVAEYNPQAYSAAMAFFVKTGSRDETDANWGVSHFLEHMVFKGTSRRSAADVNRELDEIGSNANAFTSEEQTVYYATVLPEYQRQALDILADILRPSLREDDFNTEKKVILEEIAKYEDQPPFGAHEKTMAQHFGSHALGRSVLGTVKSVSELTPEQMKSYFERRYSPSNITLVAAGKVDFDDLVSQAEEMCGNWATFDAPRQTPRAEAHSSFDVIGKPNAHQQYIIQVTNGPAARDADRFAGRILSTVIGDDSGSRMYWDLVDTGLTEYAAIGSYEYQGTGIFMTFLCCDPDSAQENIQRLHDILVDAEKGEIEQKEVELAQNKICSAIVLQSERPGNRLMSVGSNWMQRREYRTVREILDSYRSITCDDVNAILKKYPLSGGTTVAVGPVSDLQPPK